MHRTGHGPARLWLMVLPITLGLLVIAALVWHPYSQRPELPAEGECMLADGSVCPSSYFSGPLGRRNVLPEGRGALLINQYGAIGTDWTTAKAEILARERLLGRKFSSIQIQANPDPTTNGLDRERWILASGHPFVTVAWNPTYDLHALNAGKYDRTIAKAADHWRQLGDERVMIRMFTEFNLNEQVLKEGTCGPQFQQAWRRTVGIFERTGANNVGFWYVPDEGNNRDCLRDSYPGDDVVDWVGADSYNRCTAGDDDCWSTPLHPGPARFGELFGYGGRRCPGGRCPTSTHDLFGPRKPFVVGETGTVASTGSDFKTTFLKSIAEDAPAMRHLRGVSLFDFDVRKAEGAEANFKILTPDTAAVREAAKAMASAPALKAETAPPR